MKKLFLIIMLVLGTITISQAQENQTQERTTRQQMDPQQIIDSRVEDLTSRLSLTSDQITKVRAIYEKTLGTQMGSRENSQTTNANAGEPADQAQSSTEQRHTEIMELLNADQKKIYSTYLEEREQQTQERQGTRPTREE